MDVFSQCSAQRWHALLLLLTARRVLEGVYRNELMDRCLTLLSPAVAVVSHTERLCLGSTKNSR